MAHERNCSPEWSQHYPRSGSLGRSRQALSTVLNDRASLSADMALRFAREFKISADTLMRMQTAYDLAQARLQMAG